MRRLAPEEAAGTGEGELRHGSASLPGGVVGLLVGVDKVEVPGLGALLAGGTLRPALDGSIDPAATGEGAETGAAGAGAGAGEALVLLRQNGAEVGSQAVDAADEPGRDRRNPARPGRRRTDMQQA